MPRWVIYGSSCELTLLPDDSAAALCWPKSSMCFWVVLRDFSISLAAFPTPVEISLDLFLISLCRRSRIGRTVPLRFFSVSRWELARLWDGIVSRLLHSGDAVRSCSPRCLLSYSQRIRRYRQGSDRNESPPSMDLECSGMSVNLVSREVWWRRSHFQDLLVLFRMRLLGLLSGTDVLLKVPNCMLPCAQTLFEKSRGLCDISDYSSEARLGTVATHLSGIRIGHSYIAQSACASTLSSWQLRRHWGLFCGLRRHVCGRLVQRFCQRSDWETHGCADLQYEAFGDMKEI